MAVLSNNGLYKAQDEFAKLSEKADAVLDLMAGSAQMGVLSPDAMRKFDAVLKSKDNLNKALSQDYVPAKSQDRVDSSTHMNEAQAAKLKATPAPQRGNEHVVPQQEQARAASPARQAPNR